MVELIRKIGQAKAFIDNGMCRVGPKFLAARRSEEAFAGLSSRAIAFSDAVADLCGQDHPNEALAVLRELAETAVALRWLAASPDRERSAGEWLEKRAEVGWDRLWDGPMLLAHAKDLGLPAEDFERILGMAPAFAWGSRAVSPWSHVFSPETGPSADAAEVLGLAVRMMGHVLAGLDARWPGVFPGSEVMWE